MTRVPARLEAVARAIKAEKVDALVVSSFTNVTYLSGFTGDDSALLVAGKKSVMVSDGRYTTQLEQECPTLDVHIRPVGQPLMIGVAEVAGKLGCKALGFEAASLTVSERDRLAEAGPTLELKGLVNIVEALRAIKDKEEIAATRLAVDSAERAFAMLRASLRRGQSEKELADRLEGFLRDCGASAASFPPIIAVGERAALPHARPLEDSRVGDADFILIDWGATRRLYKSDLTRVLATGKVSPRFEKVYRTVLAAQEAGIAAIRPGVPTKEVDAKARAVISKAGYGKYFDHGLGHGLGIDIHEAPRLRSDSNAVLRPGMIVTVEPGIYLPEWGGVRIEDDVLVTPDGHEVLTHVAKEFEEIAVGSAA